MVTVGVAEHGNEAVLVTIGVDGAVLDRRNVALTHGLSTHPYHHEGAWALGRYVDSPWARPTTLPEAIALIERVHAAAAEGARAALDALAETVPGVGPGQGPATRIALRAWPELPPTIEARLRDNRVQTLADSVMYRRALADAAIARGWTVYAYDPDEVPALAARALGADLDAALKAMGRTLGPPWQAKHKLAAMAALAGGVQG